MAFCSACGSNIPNGLNYCPICGGSMTPNEQPPPETVATDIQKPQTLRDIFEPPEFIPPAPEIITSPETETPVRAQPTPQVTQPTPQPPTPAPQQPPQTPPPAPQPAQQTPPPTPQPAQPTPPPAPPPPTPQPAPQAVAPPAAIETPAPYQQPVQYAPTHGVGMTMGQQPPPYNVHVHPAPPTNANARPPKGSPYALVGIMSYIGLLILFAIPVIGWISCIIMAFAAGNKNIRNYARAVLILAIIGIVLTLVAYFMFAWVFASIVDNIGDVFLRIGN